MAKNIKEEVSQKLTKIKQWTRDLLPEEKRQIMKILTKLAEEEK